MSQQYSRSDQRWEHGPKIAAIGGGTGLSTMLRGLKQYTRNVTAIVTVADDGGGSGMLRQDLGMPPPGDIRHCMEATNFLFWRDGRCLLPLLFGLAGSHR